MDRSRQLPSHRTPARRLQKSIERSSDLSNRRASSREQVHREPAQPDLVRKLSPRWYWAKEVRGDGISLTPEGQAHLRSQPNESHLENTNTPTPQPPTTKHDEVWRRAFFTPSERSQAAGRTYLERQRTPQGEPRAFWPNEKVAPAQLVHCRNGALQAKDPLCLTKKITQAATAWSTAATTVLVYTVNSFITAGRPPGRAALILYPDSNHGAQYQYPSCLLRCHANPEGRLEPRGDRPNDEEKQGQVPRSRWSNCNGVQSRSRLSSPSRACGCRYPQRRSDVIQL